MVISTQLNAATRTVSVGGDIQSAIDYVSSNGGGTVTLASGTHTVTAPLLIRSNVTLQGEGNWASKLKTNTNIEIINAYEAGLDNVTIQNLEIEGINASNGSGISIISYGDNHNNVKVLNVHCHNTGWGVHIKGCDNLLVEDCLFEYNGTAGKEGYAHNLYIRRCSTVVVQNSQFLNSTSANGVNISYSTDLEFYNCEMSGNYFRGIRAANSIGFLVHNCIVQNNGDVGIIANSEGVTTTEIDWQNNCCSGNDYGMKAVPGANGVVKNNNSYSNNTNYDFPSTVSTSNNISDASQPCGTIDAFSTIEAENYSAMSGITTETTTDGEGGENITSIEEGDWLAYEIDVPRTGLYFIGYRVTSASEDGSFNLSYNGTELDQITFLKTSDDQTWTTVHSSNSFLLKQGKQTFRITANSADWKINWISLKLECAASDIISTIEEFNNKGESILNEHTSNYTIFPGNTIHIECKPTLGGTWNWIGPNEFKSESRIIDFPEIQKTQGGTYVVTYTNSCGIESLDTFNINVQDSLFIEAESYSSMNGITSENTSDLGGGSNLTDINVNDWVEYEINVPFSAIYNIDYRVASETPGDFTSSIDGTEINQIKFDATGGSQNWATVNSDCTVYLKAGMQTIRIKSKSNGWKINWIELKATQIVSECNLPYSMDGFIIQDKTIEWSSGLMDISCEPDVDIHVFLKGLGHLGELDYLNIYYKLDDGVPAILTQIQGDIDEIMVSALAIKGTTLELIVESHSESSSGFYELSKINIFNRKDPFARIEAEDYDEADGTNTENCSDTGGGENIGSIKDGNWLKFSSIDLSDVHSINARLASKNSGGSIEVRLDSENGEKIGVIDMPNTGDWQSWKTISAAIDSVVGFFDVYLVFKNPSSDVGNINWLQFSSTKIEEAVPPDPVVPEEPLPSKINEVKKGKGLVLYPNPVKAYLTIAESKNARIEIYNTIGTKVLEDVVDSNEYIISMQGLESGIYLARVLCKGTEKYYKVIKE